MSSRDTPKELGCDDRSSPTGLLIKFVRLGKTAGSWSATPRARRPLNFALWPVAALRHDYRLNSGNEEGLEHVPRCASRDGKCWIEVEPMHGLKNGGSADFTEGDGIAHLFHGRDGVLPFAACSTGKEVGRTRLDPYRSAFPLIADATPQPERAVR